MSHYTTACANAGMTSSETEAIACVCDVLSSAAEENTWIHLLFPTLPQYACYCKDRESMERNLGGVEVMVQDLEAHAPLLEYVMLRAMAITLLCRYVLVYSIFSSSGALESLYLLLSYPTTTLASY